MTDSIKLLIQAGVTRILIACNTAHVFLDKIYEKFPLAKDYIVDIIDECAAHLQKQGVKKILLLASEGTILSGIYDKRLTARGIECIAPPQEKFFMLRNFIEAVKQDNFTPEVKDSFIEFVRRNIGSAQGVILGCTELPVLHDKCRARLADINFYDPMLIALEKTRDEYNKSERVTFVFKNSDG